MATSAELAALANRATLLEQAGRLAEAEAKATLMVSQAIAKGDLQAINYFVADKYVGALKALASAPNQKVMILPMESAGILGSLAGITELARESFKDRGSPPVIAKAHE